MAARTANRLNANAVKAATKRGRHLDGHGLALQITAKGSKSWVFLYQRNHVERSMGLGPVRDVPLVLARELAAQARQSLARNVDPIDQRRAVALEQRAAAAKRVTFKEATEAYHRDNAPRWNQKHRDEWISALRRYAFPTLGHLSVADIDADLVRKVLAPINATKTVTAARLRGRLEMIFDFATASGSRTGPNPASKNVIAHLLPLRSEKANVTHQPALPYAKVPTFMAALRATEGKAARLLELQVLTAMRSEAVRHATFSEFDLDGATWTIPANRMKSLQRDHRVPLGERSIQIVRELRGASNGDLLFSGADDAHPIGKNETAKALSKLLKVIGHDQHCVPHGFRSAVKDWCHEERPHHRAEAIEMMLGHRIKSAVERSYRRGDLFRLRQTLMDDWENYCGGVEAGNIVQLRA